MPLSRDDVSMDWPILGDSLSTSVPGFHSEDGWLTGSAVGVATASQADECATQWSMSPTKQVNQPTSDDVTFCTVRIWGSDIRSFPCVSCV